MNKYILTLVGTLATLLYAGVVHAGPATAPSKGGLPACQASLNECDADLFACENAASSPHLCGNALIDAGEQCDQSNLNGQTCASLGFVGGTLQCGASCQFDTSGCTNTQFVDNKDGTVTDNKTRLMWEQTTGTIGGTNTGQINDVNNRYTWVTALTSFLATLNGVSDGYTITGCFANHCDWRLPSITELRGILDYSASGCLDSTGACIDPIFGPTPFEVYSWDPYYWTGTTADWNSDNAWSVAFIYGYSVYNQNKSQYDLYVRAVRGGS